MRIAAALSLAIVAVFAADAGAASKPRLKAFSSCKDLVTYARDGALRTRGGVGVVGRALPPPALSIAPPPLLPPKTGEPPTPAMPVSAAPDAGAAPEPFSGTNVQEADVDEPDIVKTDGKRIFAVIDRTLRVVDVASGAVTGTLALDGFDHRLLLRGNRVLVISAKGSSPDVAAARRPGGAERGAAGQHHDRDRGRRLGRAESRRGRWRSTGASSTRARTAAPRGS